MVKLGQVADPPRQPPIPAELGHPKPWLSFGQRHCLGFDVGQLCLGTNSRSLAAPGVG